MTRMRERISHYRQPLIQDEGSMKISASEYVEFANWSNKNITEQPDALFLAVSNSVNRDIPSLS